MTGRIEGSQPVGARCNNPRRTIMDGQIQIVELKNKVKDLGNLIAEAIAETGSNIKGVSLRIAVVNLKTERDEAMKDTARLEWLEKMHRENNYSDRCIWRLSTTGRGWRMHSSTEYNGSETVRAAIDAAMEDS